jgi:hypothetical protein
MQTGYSSPTSPAVPSSPQSDTPLSPTLSQRFKRKILCEPLDLDDNYYVQVSLTVIINLITY